MTSSLPLPTPYSTKRHGLTLANCDDEPVQTPGCIQAHGLLVALRLSDLVVMQVSENCLLWTGLAVDQVLGQPVAQMIGADAVLRIVALIRSESLDYNPCYALTARLPGGPVDAPAMDMSIHIADGVLLLEMEPSSRSTAVAGHDGDYFALVRKTITRLKSTQSLVEFCEAVAQETRSVTGLDRAMVYQFMDDGSGYVMADARREDLHSWLGLRYPASDIPRPAREIFLRIGVRPLPDVKGELCEMVPLRNPDTGRPLEMTFCTLRGASVMYTEYLQNMGVAAALVMPILCDGALWGLIACHHYTARPMFYAVRAAAEFVGQIASLEIKQVQTREHLEYRLKLDAAHLAVLARAALGEEVGAGHLASMVEGTPCLMDGIVAGGVAVFERGQWHTAGNTPEAEQLKLLAAWLREQINACSAATLVFATDALAQLYPAAAGFADTASGVLAMAVSRHADSALIVWCRGEQLQTFNWAGNPHEKPTSVGPNGPSLRPRRSFEQWQEQVRGRSTPWVSVELDAARNLHRLAVDLVVLNADRLAQTNAELASSNAELDTFAYVAGHDLKEPLRGINKYAHRLLEDAKLGHTSDPAQAEWLLRLTVRMDTLLDALLHYASVGRLTLDFSETDLGPVLVEAIDMLGARVAESGVELLVPRPLPTAFCDRIRVREVFSNLISNAIKYTDQLKPWVEIGYLRPDEPRPASSPAETQGSTIFYVRDKGVGIDDRHKERVFEIFKRLHATDAYGGGSGAGLTITRKMVSQHEGCIWFDSQPGAGTSFYFTLGGQRPTSP